MLNQYSRTELVLGPEAMKIISGSRVAIFGIGGVGGGSVVEALARCGIGTLDLIDDDRICLTNLNRQVLATRSSVGKYKVDVAKERVHDLDPQIQVNTYKMFYLPENADQLDFTQFDYVVDALDTVTAKIDINGHGQDRHHPARAEMRRSGSFGHGLRQPRRPDKTDRYRHLQDHDGPARPRDALRTSKAPCEEAQGRLFDRTRDPSGQ